MLFDVRGDYGKKMKILEKGINTAVMRRNVIANNVANVDTPFFKRSEITFESQMKRAIDSEKKEVFPALMTDKRHISFESKIDYLTVRPNIVTEYDSNYRNDKNNVDIDKEMADATKNALMYNAMSEMYSRNLKMLDIVMR